MPRSAAPRRRGVLAAPLLAITILASCAPPASPPRPSPGTLTTSSITAPPAQAPDALAGTVSGPAGAPVEGAVIAAIPNFELDPGEGEPTAILTRSERGGAFRFPKLAPGRYGVTASSPGLTAAYGGVAIITAGGQAQSIALKLGGDGFEISGAVAGDTGAPIRGAIVGAIPLSEAEKSLFITTTGDDGRYSLTVPTGVPYFLIAEAPPRPRTHRRIDPEKQVIDIRLEPAPPPRPSDEAIVAWLRRSAIPLTTARPGGGLDDMDRLRATIGDARIVALGEATHGSAEIFEVKHRFIELLVERMGFTTIALETGFSEALEVNEHVLHGRGDALTALAALNTTPLQTEEILALIRWMRRYNENPAHKKKIRFQGFDIVTPAAYDSLVAYLKRVDPRAEPAAREALLPLRDLSMPSKGAPDPKVIAATQKAIADVIALLDANKKVYGARTSAAAWDIARQHATVLQQAEAMFRDPSLRDPGMADNVKWLVDRMAPDEKIVLWAHNTHVSFSPLGFSDLGRILRKRYAKDYFVIGTSFNQGAFRALDGWGAEVRSPGVKDHTIGPAPTGSLDASLALAKLPLFTVDLRTAPSPIDAWLASRIPVRSIGFYFIDEKRALYRTAPSKSYDAIVFLDKVTAARPITLPKKTNPTK
jgi:erythromycin esterase